MVDFQEVEAQVTDGKTMFDTIRDFFADGGSGWTVAQFVFTLVLPILGFLLALALLSEILRDRRPPANAMAWLIAIVLMPYVGVPLYLLLGKRKAKPSRRQKPTLRETRPVPAGAGCEEEVLLTYVASGVYPSTVGNELCLLGDGVKAYQTIMDGIRGAERCIHIATYILADDPTGRAILEALSERAAAGVEVYLLLDAYGAFAYPPPDLSALRSAGAKVAFFMRVLRWPLRGRMNWRNHRKMILIDQETVITGGMNLADEYMGPEPMEGRWQDLMVRAEGPTVTDFYEVFRADWKFAVGEQLSEVAVLPLARTQDCDTAAQVIASGPDVEGDPLHDAILIGLFGAKERAWVITPYFLPDTSIMNALTIAAQRGLDVRLLMPKKSNHLVTDIARGSYLRDLDNAGVRVMLFEDGMMHAKALIVDDAISVVGTANMDMRSMFLNYEIALCTISTVLVDELAAWAQSLMDRSTEGVKKRGAAREMLEGIGRLLAPLL